VEVLSNSFKVYFEDGSNNIYHVISRPDTCPRCHVTIRPIFERAYYIASEYDEVMAVLRCPNLSCGRLFFSIFKDQKFSYSEPSYPQKPNLDETIIDISNRFYDIYFQALAAKSMNLIELVGVGLRKSLEILIKDYCISRNPSAAEKIKSSSLYDCIEQYCDRFVKKCAHATRVLGNDEAHYERKYHDKDINDLEKLIAATIHWIGAELIANS
jgi:hypothetical protein